MSVAGDYEFLAIARSSGRIVHGIEPEFEDPREVTPSLATLFEDMIAGRATAGANPFDRSISGHAPQRGAPFPLVRGA
jgi:hypothetical protein